MNIVPSSTIYLLKDVPLDPDFQHTIRFTSPSEQISYFGRGSLHVATFTNQMYQRYAKGTLRISANAEDLYECNYLCFQNTGHKNNAKWFYAFVTSVDYINENVTEISYKIDPIQTYMFNFTLGYCFIEREHCETDDYNFQAVPENLDCGEYMSTLMGRISWNNEIAVYSAYDLTQWEVDRKSAGGYSEFDGVYDGIVVNRYGADKRSCDELTSAIMDSPSGVKSEGIKQIRVVPTLLGNERSYDPDTDEIDGGSLKYIVKPMSIGGYTPRNKKLWTYPYFSILADDNMGNKTEFKYELFGYYDPEHRDRMYFQCIGTYSPSPILSVIPLEYKGSHINWTERMVISDFPSCAWDSSVYQDWVARNTAKLSLTAISSGLSVVSGVAAQNPTLVAGGLAGIAGLLAEKHDRKQDPLRYHGNPQGDSLMNGLGRQGIDFYSLHITTPMAEVIDTFFDTYGYAVNKVKLPNLYGGGRLRPRWNYLKTRNCQLLKSDLPAYFASEICKIFDNGITFWNNPSEVANYSNPQTNLPTEG